MDLPNSGQEYSNARARCYLTDMQERRSNTVTTSLEDVSVGVARQLACLQSHESRTRLIFMERNSVVKQLFQSIHGTMCMVVW